MSPERKKIIFIMLAIVVMIAIFYLLFRFLFPRNNQIPQVPVFTPPIVSPGISAAPQPSQIPTYQGIKQIFTEAEKTKAAQEILVSDFASKLPITEKDFIISYDLKTNTFTVLITGNPDAVLGELNILLKQNGIMDRSWIKKLVFKS